MADKFSIETGLNAKGQFVIVCSEPFIEELKIELKAMMLASRQEGKLIDFICSYPAIGALYMHTHKDATS